MAMTSASRSTPYPYIKPAELDGNVGHCKVAIVGAGPIGLTLAIDLAQRGVASVVFDENNVVSVGSRAICWAKRSLEIFDRLGVGERMLAKGVTWQVGRLFHRSKEVYRFDLLPEEGHKFPAFINLQQYYVETYLIERALEFPTLIDLRFRNTVIGHDDRGDTVSLQIETPDGIYDMRADYLVACDGARSPTRARMGLEFEGQTFDEQFLIVDVHIPQSPFPTDRAERWFWFEPTFHEGQSALLHKQPDDIYRIDLQLGPEADAEKESEPERISGRLEKMLGDRVFTIDWFSIYRFTCARLNRFVHGRVIFCGDSAHVVSPFGARGGNGGIHDVDNLGWKMARILEHGASSDILASYDRERCLGADENIKHSARTTRFMTPKTPFERLLRDEVLGLSRTSDFARRLINGGRLSWPCSYRKFTGDVGQGSGLWVGDVFLDAPLAGTGIGWLCELIGPGFVALKVDSSGSISVTRYDLNGRQLESAAFQDEQGFVRARYKPGLNYLIRPDGHVVCILQETAAKTLSDRVLHSRWEDLHVA